MSRVLAYTSPARGHLFPLAAILIELARRGHEVVVKTLPSCVELMRGQGFVAEGTDPRIEAVQHEDWRERTSRRRLVRSVETFTARAPYDAADLKEAIDRLQPDVVLADVNSWGALTVAERWGGPWATFCPYPLVLRSRDVPPFGPGLSPARGPLGRLRDQMLRPLVLGAVQHTMLPPLNDLRRRSGLPALSSLDEVFLRPPLLLYLTAEPFEYPRTDWPSNLVAVGPCPWEPPHEVPGWLHATSAPLVVVSTSSERQDDLRLVSTAFEALADEPVHVVATIPAHAADGIAVPDNGRIEAFLPHSLLLDRAACVVTHGGMGVTQKALAQGVPVCAVPFGRDQHEVARRVEVAGAGTRLPARRLRPDRLRAAVLEAIVRRDGAARVAAGFAAAGGPAAAADAVEKKLLGTPAPR